MKKTLEQPLIHIPPMAIKYLDPKVDIVFKRIFGTRKHITIDFLNAMLPLDSPIVDLEFVAEQLKPEQPDGKFSIVDVRCRDANGRHFLVEMQNRWERWFIERIFYSSSLAYVNQLKRGMDYDVLKPVYMLALLDTTFMPDEPEVWHHHFYTVRNGRRPEGLQFIEAVIAELPKHPDDALNSPRDLWTWFLSETDETLRDAPDELKAYAPIHEALEMSEEAAFDDAERYRYQKELDAQRVARGLERSQRERDERLAKQGKENEELSLKNQELSHENQELSHENQELSHENQELSRALTKAEADRKRAALNMYEEKMSPETIARILNEDIEVVKAWLGIE